VGELLPIPNTLQAITMKKLYNLLILLFFTANFVFGQSIQHESRKLFVMTLDIPENIRNSNSAFTKFVQKNSLKQVLCLRNGQISSKINFDKNGNVITKIENDNRVTNRSELKYDDNNQIIEKKNFKPDGSFRNGYYYRYENGSKFVYEIKDSLLINKYTFIKRENINIYSRYDTTGIIISKSIHIKDTDMKWLLETRFQKDRISVQYRYEYLGDKKYITKVQFDENGTKISEKRHLDEIKTDNKLEHYTEDDERLFRVDSFDENGNLLKMELFDKNDGPTRTENSKYNSIGQLIELIKEDFRRDQIIIYTYKYDKSDRVELVEKEFNEEKEIFTYEYETF